MKKSCKITLYVVFVLVAALIILINHENKTVCQTSFDETKSNLFAYLNIPQTMLLPTAKQSH